MDNVAVANKQDVIYYRLEGYLNGLCGSGEQDWSDKEIRLRKLAIACGVESHAALTWMIQALGGMISDDKFFNPPSFEFEMTPGDSDVKAYRIKPWDSFIGHDDKGFYLKGGINPGPDGEICISVTKNDWKTFAQHTWMILI